MAARASDKNPPQQRPKKPLGWLKKAGKTVLEQLKHTGVGLVCSVAYFDPGNWGVDLQAGSQFGYRLLFVVLLSGLFAVLLQVLATRLGTVTGLDLAGHTRLLLYNRTKHPRLVRWLTLYPLYVLAEIAIIATDLAELLGSAIALCLLFPKLQLWQGVLITSADVILVLAIGDPLGGKPNRKFEWLIGSMVFAVLVCMAIIISEIQIGWGDTFMGYLPSKYVFGPGALYTSIGIVGATVMPHSLFLGSALATQDRINSRPARDEDFIESTTSSKALESDESLDSAPSSRSEKLWASLKESILRMFKTPPKSLHATEATRHSDHETNPYDFVRAHIGHGVADVLIALLGFAVMINSMILILASAVFYYGGNGPNGGPASLFDAYDLVRDIIGQGAATLFALALLAAGQSSSFIATVAGQAVAEGFIRWRVSPVIRRLITRLIAIIPSMAVAIGMGQNGINALLVASQVVLSLVLPFVTLPLLICTSRKDMMRARKIPSDGDEQPAGEGGDIEGGEQWVDYSNGKIVIGLGALIWIIILVANAYVLIDLAMTA